MADSEGRVDLLAIGLLEHVTNGLEQRLQINGLSEVVKPLAAEFVAQHLGEYKLDPWVLGLGRLIWNNYGNVNKGQ